jgi:hypothetical protein
VRLLLVAWHFPPVNTIAAVRLGKLARHVVAAGHALRVVTADRPEPDRSLPQEVDEALVRRTPHLDIDRVLDPRRWRERRPGPGAAPAARATGTGPAPAGQGSALGRLYRGLAFFPDRQVGWGRHLLPALAEEIRTFRPDLLLASGPPFSPLLWTARAAGRAGLPWVAELRDRWANDTYTEIPAWRRPLDAALERRTLRRAAGLVTVSEPWREAYAAAYGLPTTTVMNGYDPADLAGLEDTATAGLPLRILHVGTVYRGRRDPTPLLRALALPGLGADAVRLVCHGREIGWVGELAQALGVADRVELAGPVPYRRSLALQAGADVLLLLQWDAPGEEGNVPGKLFEYLAAARPILVIGPEEGVPARLVRERRAGLVAAAPEAIAAWLRGLVEAKRATGRVAALPGAARAGLTRAAQYDRLLAFLEERAPARGQHGTAGGGSPGAPAGERGGGMG